MAIKERNSSIELARILAMLSIVCTHFFQQGRIITSVVPEDRFWFLFLSNGGRIAVNVFVLISCYFLCDNATKIGKAWVRSYTQLVFYSWAITTTLLLLGLLEGRASAIELGICYLPFFGRPLWFISAYLTLLLAIPFLKKAEEVIPTHITRAFLIVSALILWVNCFCVALFDQSNMNYILDTIWFMLLFLATSHIKHTTKLFVSINKWCCLAIGVGLYLILNALHFSLVTSCFSPSIANFLQKINAFCIVDFKSPINILIAFCCFSFFLQTKLKTNKIINFLAAPTLAIYIIHQQPLFYNFLWFEILDVNAWRGGPYTLLIGIFLTIVLYLALASIEYIRRLLIDSWLLKTKFIYFIENKIDNLLGITTQQKETK